MGTTLCCWSPRSSPTRPTRSSRRPSSSGPRGTTSTWPSHSRRRLDVMRYGRRSALCRARTPVWTLLRTWWMTEGLMRSVRLLLPLSSLQLSWQSNNRHDKRTQNVGGLITLKSQDRRNCRNSGDNEFELTRGIKEKWNENRTSQLNLIEHDC